MTCTRIRWATPLVGLFLTLGLVACGGGSPPPSGASLEVDAAERVMDLADAYVRDYFKAFPYQAPISGAEDLYPDRLGDHSLGALAAWARRRWNQTARNSPR